MMLPHASKFAGSPLFVILGLFTALTVTAQAPAQKLTIFDAPGAGTGPNQGTSPSGISLGGTITGNLTDSGYGTHGFVRTPEGQFTILTLPVRILSRDAPVQRPSMISGWLRAI
jgi:hypothetical protein